MTRPASAYIRVSTIAQAGEEKHGLARQRDEIEKYVLAAGLTLTETFFDTISGKTVTRRGFDRLRAAQPAVIVISSVDRLARDMAGSFRLLSELMELGAELHSADVGLIDLSQDLSVMHFGFSSLMAHLEHSGIKRRTQSARVAMAERGLYPGGFRVYGYTTARGRVIPHPERGDLLRRIYTLSASGHTFNDIGILYDREGVTTERGTRKETYLEDGELRTRIVATRWHAATVAQIVRRPIYYQGFCLWGRHEIPVPPLVPEELWRKAQRRQGAPARLDWPLTHHLRCGYCGRRMSGIRETARGRGGGAYRCQHQRSGTEPRCSFRLAKAKAEARFETALRETLEDPVALAALLRPAPQDPELGRKRAELEAESKEAFKTWRRGVITADELAEVRREIGERRADLDRQAEPEPALPEVLSVGLADLTLKEILDRLPVVATLTRESTTLHLE